MIATPDERCLCARDIKHELKSASTITPPVGQAARVR